MAEMPHADARGVRGQAQDAPRVSHQNGGRRIAVGGPQFFDHHDVGARGEHDRAQLVVERAEAPLQRVAGVGNDNARFDQTRVACTEFDCAVPGHA